LVVERVINKGFADKMNNLPVKIVVSHQYLVFSKENTEKKKEIISPSPCSLSSRERKVRIHFIF